MFLLEVICCSGEEEVCTGQLYDSYEAVKDTLTQTDWIRFVVTELISDD